MPLTSNSEKETWLLTWEGKRRLLLSGFGNGDSHQTINSFTWSPDGELWFCQGDGIESRVETPHGVASLFQAGVFRPRPETLQLDPLLDDFMGPGNPWGVAFDDFYRHPQRDKTHGRIWRVAKIEPGCGGQRNRADLSGLPDYRSAARWQNDILRVARQPPRPAGQNLLQRMGIPLEEFGDTGTPLAGISM
ncbi:MAG: hypothetical protein ACI9MB_002214 [Verrucomicrobiales bacterium]|jgi:hypothetical protein